MGAVAGLALLFGLLAGASAGLLHFFGGLLEAFYSAVEGAAGGGLLLAALAALRGLRLLGALAAALLLLPLLLLLLLSNLFELLL